MFCSAVILGVVALYSLPASADAVDKYNSHMAQEVCEDRFDPEGQDCLSVLSYKACSSGCYRRGYNAHLDKRGDGQLEIHQTNSYLKKLSSAAASEPDSYPDPEYRIYETATGENDGDADALNFIEMLYSQVQMMLVHPDTILYDDERNKMSLGEAKYSGKNTIDPERLGSVAFTSGDGNSIAHAMDQADFGRTLIKAGLALAKENRMDKAPYYLSLARAVFEPFRIRHNEGGVRNNKTGHRCLDWDGDGDEDNYCYWFHSKAASDRIVPSTVLNQHLHAVRDALLSYHDLATWRDNGLCPCSSLSSGVKQCQEDFKDNGTCPFAVIALPPEVDEDFILRLREWGRGGLAQLTHDSPKTQPGNSLPNLGDFLRPRETHGGKVYYSAYYQYWLDDYVDVDINPSPRPKNWGPADISHNNNIKYHFHDLDLFAGILRRIESSEYMAGNPTFDALYYRLLYGRDAGDTRSCQDGPTNMSGVPLAEMEMTALVPQQWQQGTDHAQDYRDGNRSARDYFDEVYADCFPREGLLP